VPIDPERSAHHPLNNGEHLEEVEAGAATDIVDGARRAPRSGADGCRHHIVDEREIARLFASSLIGRGTLSP